MASNDTGERIAPADNTRYTLDGDAAVEACMDRDQQVIGDGLTRLMDGHGFRALVLMGGYGRGEGGFTRVDGEPAPYNDYDYFVVTRGLSKADQQTLHDPITRLAHELEHQVGVDVDFAFLREEALPQAEFSLMNAEMLWGHRVVAGDEGVLKAMPPMPFSKLGLHEFTRLMLNRGSLLLMNAMELDKAGGQAGISDPVERERFVKYLFKAVLACADALLAAEGRYHPSYVKKQERLGESDWDALDTLKAQYALALEAKFHPDYSEHVKEDLDAWQETVRDLWLAALHALESRRLGYPAPGWRDYASASVPKGQGRAGAKGVLRNVLVNLRDFGVLEPLKRPLWSRRYPRERLISVLPMLLQGELDGAARTLGCDPKLSWRQTAEAFIAQWHRYA
ncbi:MAG: hypothetical protein ACPGUC_02540 [Gammaproteobacteria bacterium]